MQLANKAFDILAEHLPARISMPFMAYKILKEIVPEGQERYILNYFWLQVPKTSVAKHEEKWQNMLRTVRCLIPGWTAIRTPAAVWIAAGVKGFVSRWAIGGFISKTFLQLATTPMPAQIKLWGDGFPHTTSNGGKTLKGRTAQSSPKDNVL